MMMVVVVVVSVSTGVLTTCAGDVIHQLHRNPLLLLAPNRAFVVREDSP
jgi:hypothetical protein